VLIFNPVLGPKVLHRFDVESDLYHHVSPLSDDREIQDDSVVLDLKIIA
jgi:hypothetical protein